MARDRLAQQAAVLTPVTHEKATWILGTLVGPWLGAWPILEVGPPEVLAVLKRIEARGKHETAHRAKQRISQVFRYAIGSGRRSETPCSICGAH